MCGIAGFWSPARAVSLRVLKEMSERLEHRGPDDRGYLTLVGSFSEEGQPRLWGDVDTGFAARLGLAHRRLSILDVTQAGRQPMSSRDGRVWVSFNGEIYNYVELRHELELMGYNFVTGTDTEVAIAAYQAWGSDCFARFTGMFAMSLLDLTRRTLVLARDPFGIKPLYYAEYEGALYFASEVSALMVLPRLRRVDPQIAFDYLAYGLVDHSDATFVQGVRQVPAAHFLTIDLQRDRPTNTAERFWSLDLDRRIDATPEEAAGEFRRLFLESVALHLRSDVPLGSCLSGGIDSSSIVCAVAELLEVGTEQHTFSYVAREAGVDESAYAELVNTHVGARPHMVEADPGELVDDLTELVRLQDYPFGSTSIYAQQRVFRLAGENGIKVMLDGQGADELLAGYGSYVGAYIAQSLRMLHLNLLTATIVRVLRQRSMSPRMLALHAGSFIVPSALHDRARRLMGEPIVPAWLDEGWVDRHVATVVQTRTGVTDSRRALREYMLHQLTSGSLPALLRYEDRNSMSHSIESRVPFLTPQIAEFVFALPDREVLDGGVTKPVLRRAMRGLVPDRILDRRDKVGFATPERSWLTGPLAPYVKGVITSDTARAIPALNSAELVATLGRLASGRERWNFKVWRWINLIEWTRMNEMEWDT